MLLSSSPDEIKQHVSYHFLRLQSRDIPEKLYSVDSFRKSVLTVGFFLIVYNHCS